MSTCKWNGPNQPRVLVGRHGGDCDPAECRGCQPCLDQHCTVDGREHVEDSMVCPECRASVRDDLRAIVRLHGDALADALAAGVDSNAAMIVGPSANPEAWNHRAASAHVGRVDASYLSDCRHEMHPLFVLGSWEQDWRDVFDQPSDLLLTVKRAADYLDRNLERAGKEHLAFDEFAQDVRKCRRWLEDVLYDGEREERTQVKCVREDCHGRLVLHYGDKPDDDHYTCPRCRQRYTLGEFARAKLIHLHSEGADRWVSLADGMAAIDRPEFTVRTWVRRCLVRSFCDMRTRKLQVWWPDLRRMHQETEARLSRRKSA